MEEILSEMDSLEKEFKHTVNNSPSHKSPSSPEKSPTEGPPKNNVVPMESSKQSTDNPSYQTGLEQLEKDLDHLEQKKTTSQKPLPPPPLPSSSLPSPPHNEHSQKPIGVMKFSGMGRMNQFQMNFSLGKKNVEFVIGDTLIKMTMPGLEVSIDETNGCQINPSAGTRLMIPIK